MSSRNRIHVLLLCALVSIACAAVGCKDAKGKAKKTKPTMVVTTAPAIDPILLTAPADPPDFRATLKIEEFNKRYDAAVARLPATGESEKATSPALQWDLAYLQSDHRNKRWDDLVRVAIATCHTDPPLAEMAMRAATRIDYPQGWISHLVGLVVNAESGRSDDAMNFYALLKKTPEAAKYPLPYDLIYRAAVAEFKLPDAIEASSKGNIASEPVMEHLKLLVAAHQSRSDTDRKSLSLEEQDKSMRHENLLAQLQPLNDETKWFIQQLHRAKHVQTGPSGGGQVSWVFAPKDATRDVDYTIRLSLAVVDKTSGSQERPEPSFSVGLFDRENPQPSSLVSAPEAGGMLGVRFAAGSNNVDVFHGDGQVILHTATDAKFDLKQSITLRLLRLNGRDALFVNNRQILYVPSAGNPRQIGAYIKAVGMNARLWSVKLVALKPGRDLLAQGE